VPPPPTRCRRRQRKLVYVPSLPGAPRREYMAAPDRVGLRYEELWLVTEDGVRLHAWLCAAPGAGPLPRAPTLLFFQENAGNISHRLQNVRYMVQQLACNVLIVSYRGCVGPRRAGRCRARALRVGSTRRGARAAALPRPPPYACA
jgi:hypothetical protein